MWILFAWDDSTPGNYPAGGWDDCLAVNFEIIDEWEAREWALNHAKIETYFNTLQLVQPLPAGLTHIVEYRRSWEWGKSKYTEWVEND